ncbi:hypothetical protein PSEUDO8AS_60308 [Pseudomonas sp. 8AS]|nr:hypothetical protein PSEUDO8AS_60308 [Pseudomonas sp. 8AS]
MVVRSRSGGPLTEPLASGSGAMMPFKEGCVNDFVVSVRRHYTASQSPRVSPARRP